ncbi:hypothetical protein DXG01_005159, partial [Tephrocybe rancida]
PPSDDLIQAFTSPRNVFGLSRTYYRKELPSHDPEDFLILDDLNNIPSPSTKASISDLARSPYFPYPNKNLFALGKWFWCSGVQKSQKSFKELIDIIGADDFRPDNVRNTRWGAVNQILGQNDFDKGNKQQE